MSDPFSAARHRLRRHRSRKHAQRVARRCAARVYPPMLVTPWHPGGRYQGETSTEESDWRNWLGRWRCGHLSGNLHRHRGQGANSCRADSIHGSGLVSLAYLRWLQAASEEDEATDEWDLSALAIRNRNRQHRFWHRNRSGRRGSQRSRRRH
ncbi:MAG: hypothetical protein EA401_11000 [Planctomycetota bacterium]|nr:MAG: hypothetical protein EA401_11000 [Planctomycetota bacterium]